jgi:hypothetical protein
MPPRPPLPAPPRPRTLFLLTLLLAVWYGLCLGTYALAVPRHPGRWSQILAAAVKVPCVLLTTLVVSFLFGLLLNALFRTAIPVATLWHHTLRTLAAMAMFLALLSPIAIVVGLFRNYAACVLTNYLLIALSGAAASLFLGMLLRNESHRGGHYAPRPWRFLFLWVLWVILFASTGLSIGYVLRPYIGYAGQPFTWFRSERSSVFQQISSEWHNLLGH